MKSEESKERLGRIALYLEMLLRSASIPCEVIYNEKKETLSIGRSHGNYSILTTGLSSREVIEIIFRQSCNFI